MRLRRLEPNQALWHESREEEDIVYLDVIYVFLPLLLTLTRQVVWLET